MRYNSIFVLASLLCLLIGYSCKKKQDSPSTANSTAPPCAVTSIQFSPALDPDHNPTSGALSDSIGKCTYSYNADGTLAGIQLFSPHNSPEPVSYLFSYLSGRYAYSFKKSTRGGTAYYDTTRAEYTSDGTLAKLYYSEGYLEFGYANKVIATITFYLREFGGTYSLGSTSSVTWDGNGNIAKIVTNYGNFNDYTTYQYDNKPNRLKGMPLADIGMLEQEKNVSDLYMMLCLSNNNEVSERDQNGNIITHTYDYNDKGMPTVERVTNNATAAVKTYTFTYDCK